VTRSENLDYLIPVYKIEGVVYSNGSTAEFFQYVPGFLRDSSGTHIFFQGIAHLSMPLEKDSSVKRMDM